MNPVVVIPTFVSTRSQREGGSIITTYDHPTPLSQEGELPPARVGLAPEARLDHEERQHAL